MIDESPAVQGFVQGWHAELCTPQRQYLRGFVRGVQGVQG